MAMACEAQLAENWCKVKKQTGNTKHLEFFMYFPSEL